MKHINNIIKGRVPNLPRILLVLLLVSIGFIIFAMDTNLDQIGISLLIFLIFSLWGHVVVYQLYYKYGDILCGFIWGSISGIAIASLITSVIVYLIGWNLPPIFCIISLLPAIILILQFSSKRATLDQCATDQSQFVIILLLVSLITVTLFFLFPYKNLGVLVGNQYLYAWLFGHDFINRLVHIESLSRGIPLGSMLFSGETLSYYWLAYVFPALLHNMKIVTLEIQQLLQLTQFYYSLLTTAALILLLKKYIQEKNIFIITTMLALCCYSYVWLINFGIEVLKIVSKFYPLVISESIMNFSGFSHGYYRFFLVEPQAILAIGLILMILNTYEPSMSTYMFGLIGLLLGLLFGVEATNGIMLMLWFGGMGLFNFLKHKQARFQLALKHIISVTCVFLVYAVLFSIKMYSFSTGKGALQLSPNWFALKAGIAYFSIAYGPPFIFGIAGLIRLFNKKESYSHWAVQYVVLLGVGLFFVFFIQNPTEYHFGLLKATRIVPISLLMLTAYFLQTRVAPEKIGKGIIVLIFMALPSIVSDNFIASDISNPSTFVRSTDMDAARWIKKNIPPDAIVQAEPDYPGVKDNGIWPKYAYSFIPIYSQRKTAIGEWKVSSQEHKRPEEVAERFHAIMQMYKTSNIKECVEIIKKYGINYIYVGDLEKSKYGDWLDKFNDVSLFELVYRHGNSSIYKVIEGMLILK